ncbi:hypothetical protein RD055328_02650 [Companilactobacillus sp. RD055328]|uniref:CPBP family glutamic-type intramembrane protease n=1 Tax=Companilactobacillus sp. RD055328 TaxID=2916634 RepID=UPI001FC7FB13|nr:CPBP family glutamic-type intramembrane protease [Companilactobacillus sp. RD055328]GKQ42342.1 hypothetical protein RD055328_02650 [Companilactobacillus sp. RD055328]
MQEVESRGTTVIRYIFWLLFAALTIFLREEAVSSTGLNLILAGIFAAVGIFTSWIMSHRYTKERMILNNPRVSFKNTVINNFGFVFWVIILIGAIRFGIAYLQYKGIMPKFENDYLTSTDQKVMIFNLLANIFIISYQQFMVANAFLFNYFWRKKSGIQHLLGIIMSAVVLAIINLSNTPQQFLLFFLLGLVYAVVYRKTKDAKMTMLIIMFSNILGSILL